MKEVIIAGGSGFLGRILENHFSKHGYIIKILTRTPKKKNHIFWDAKTLGDWSKELNHTDIIINLTGKSVDCRYTDANKRLIYDSRIDSTAIIGKALTLVDHPPKIWMNSSTATIYKHSYEQEMTEATGQIGNDFSMNVARAWEETIQNTDLSETRKIILRTSIVLGNKGGAFPKLKTLVKYGMGGKQGNGNQKISWIHEFDFARAILFLIENENLSGVFNITSPHPIKNSFFMKSLRGSIGIPIGLNQSKLLLELGARLLGIEAELVLKSRNVIPERLSKSKFEFIYPDLNSAVKDLLK